METQIFDKENVLSLNAFYYSDAKKIAAPEENRQKGIFGSQKSLIEQNSKILVEAKSDFGGNKNFDGFSGKNSFGNLSIANAQKNVLEKAKSAASQNGQKRLLNSLSLPDPIINGGKRLFSDSKEKLNEEAPPVKRSNSALSSECVFIMEKLTAERMAANESAANAHKEAILSQIPNVYMALRRFYKMENRTRVRLFDAQQKLSNVVRPKMTASDIGTQLRYVAEVEPKLLRLTEKGNEMWIEWEPREKELTALLSRFSRKDGRN